MTILRTSFPGSWTLVPLLGLLLAQIALAQISSNMSSRFLAKGEYARFEISISGREPDRPPMPPAVKDVRIESGRMGMISRRTLGQDLEYSYEFHVISDVPGRHVIPPITFMMGAQRYQSPSIEFWVFDPGALRMSEVEVAGRRIPYYASFHTAKSSAYEGETMPAEIKVYVPSAFAQNVADWGVPEFERDGVTSWRFEPGDRRDMTEVYISGQRFASLAYPSTLAPSKTGTVGIGPATLRLTSAALVEGGGFPRREYQEVYLNIPKHEFEAKPLPPGAPKGFENAVGQFTISSEVSKTEITEGESLAVTLTVTGSGNLDSLNAPKLSDDTGWKVYNPIAVPRGDERRFLYGSATFHQGILPLEIKPAIPPFQLVYFDPEEEIYKTASTQPVNLIMLPSTKPPSVIGGPPPALSMPIERMTDILALVTPKSLTVSSVPAVPSWAGHAAGALAALALLAKAVWMRVAPRLQKDPAKERQKNDLRRLESIPSSDRVALLKSAGAYIEHWHGANPSPELREILSERDRVCFRSDKAPGDTAPDRRNEILRTLRKASLAVILFCGLCLSNPASANISEEAGKAYEETNYAEAIRLWQSAGDFNRLSADTLYNIGNASYRLGSPGHAALYYRRALLKDPTHAEARQNLRFIERKFGSITVHYSNYQHALAKFPLSGWKTIFWGGAWLTVISFLVFPATRSGAQVRVAAAVLLVLGPLVASVGALGWRYYPNDSVFASAENQAVIIVPKTVLHSDAARTAPEVIDAPEGSLCEIIRVSGKWAYVSFASRTRGWVHISTIEKLIPDKPLSVPKVSKPLEEEGSSA